jgi:lipoprotein NlpI
LGDHDKGLELINYSLTLDPDNSYAYKNRAKYYIETGDPKKALRDLLQAKAMGYDEQYGAEVDEIINELQNK